VQIALFESGVQTKIRVPSALERVQAEHWDIVVTLAREDEMQAPPVVGGRNERWVVDDPLSVPGFNRRLAVLRAARDTIAQQVDEMLRSLDRPPPHRGLARALSRASKE
jgi:hypothetical protein